jgi:hypothetical protein
MSAPSGLRPGKSKLRKWSHKWFGANRGTHWTIAGSVAVIILGSYLVYNSRGGNPTTTTSTVPAAERPPARTAPGPSTTPRG